MWSLVRLFQASSQKGDTLAEARRMARDAIRAYLESLRKDGELIPSDSKFVSDPVKEKISVAIPA